VELERGSQIVEDRGRLLEVEGGPEYLRGLGQLYLACQLLEAAMMAHVPRSERPPAFRQHLNRCSQAWGSGESLFTPPPFLPYFRCTRLQAATQ